MNIFKIKWVKFVQMIISRDNHLKDYHLRKDISIKYIPKKKNIYI